MPFLPQGELSLLKSEEGAMALAIRPQLQFAHHGDVQLLRATKVHPVCPKWRLAQTRTLNRNPKN